MIIRAKDVVCVVIGTIIILSSTVVPVGHVGVVDFLGSVNDKALSPGLSWVKPGALVWKMSTRTVEIKETASTPTAEGLIVEVEVSLLAALQPEGAIGTYKAFGLQYQEICIIPQFRSAIREMTASFGAKALYSAQRAVLEEAILARFRATCPNKWITAQQVLLRHIKLPDVVSAAISEKLKREQESQQMQFVLEKERQEAERKSIEAKGIADFQKIVSEGITPGLLDWKGIEATENLARSANAKMVFLGNGRGLPLLLNGQEAKEHD